MRFKHTNRCGFLLGFIDFFSAGLEISLREFFECDLFNDLEQEIQ